MIKKLPYKSKLAEAFSELVDAKRSKRFLEAKAKMAAEAVNKPSIRREAARITNRREDNRLVPNFGNYVLIGQASIARILPNATQISLSTVYLPNYRGEFFLVDQDTVSKRTYRLTDFNSRQQISFSPPFGSSEFTSPWLIGVIAGAPILSLSQANIVIQRNRRP